MRMNTSIWLYPYVEQWGLSIDSANITFPIPFTTPYTITGSVIADYMNNSDHYYLLYLRATEAKFDYSNMYVKKVFYIAIGSA